jgi:hypothetical protein
MTMGMKPCPSCDSKYGTSGIKHGDKLPPCPNSKGK